MKVCVFDIETFFENSLFCFYFPIENQWFSFSIDKNKSDLYKLIKFLESKKEVRFIGFNSLNFDIQVIEYIIRNYNLWFDLENLEICKKIWQKAQDIIHDTNFGLFPPYREEELYLKTIDLFKIHHLDNDSRRCSLKWLEFMMDLENIQEIPYNHKQENLTNKQLIKIEEYCKNDILATYKFYKFTIGDCEHEFYRGKNKIQDRLDLINEGLLPEKAINYSDSKIGDELNKSSYCQLTGKTIKELYELKKNRKPTKKFTFGEAIPEYVNFKTPELISFYESIKNVTVSLKPSDDMEFPLKFDGMTYYIARGGIHSSEKNRQVIAKEDEFLRDADVGAQYPNAINKRNLYPVHLGKDWNKVGYRNIVTKDKYKQLYKKDGLPKWKGLETMFKNAMNAGFFGKTLETTNWQYGPEVGYFCTIGNQFEILMLIEMLYLNGIKTISGNTDGILCLFPKHKETVYYKTCNEWEEIVGNSILGKLEYTDFKAIFQESVNHYIAIKSDDSLKIKGRFAWEVELNKNNTDKVGRIERKAIVNYFNKGISPEETIKSSNNIFDFVRGKKSSKDYFFRLIDTKSGASEEFSSVVRYIVCKNNKKLLKIKHKHSDKTGPEISECEAPDDINIWYCDVINSISPNKKIQEYNINYEFYIKKAEEIIKKIDKSYNKHTDQISLF